MFSSNIHRVLTFIFLAQYKYKSEMQVTNPVYAIGHRANGCHCLAVNWGLSLIMTAKSRDFNSAPTYHLNGAKIQNFERNDDQAVFVQPYHTGFSSFSKIESDILKIKRYTSKKNNPNVFIFYNCANIRGF